MKNKVVMWLIIAFCSIGIISQAGNAANTVKGWIDNADDAPATQITQSVNE